VVQKPADLPVFEPQKYFCDSRFSFDASETERILESQFALFVFI
jgi:hypothetical protein